MLAFTLAMALGLCVILASYTSVLVHGQSVKNEVDQVNTQTIEAVEKGSTAENVARNLASFKDSSYLYTVHQSNIQDINDVTGTSAANNANNNVFIGTSFDDSRSDVSDANTIDQLSPAYAQLTTGDMARLTDEQRYTLDEIENRVFWLTRDNETENTSTLTEDEISMKIFEYFINEGITLCRETDGFICKDNLLTASISIETKSLLEIYNDTITDKYKEIVQQNPTTPFSGIAEFFGW